MNMMMIVNGNKTVNGDDDNDENNKDFSKRDFMAYIHM